MKISRHFSEEPRRSGLVINLYFSNTTARRLSTLYTRYIKSGEKCYRETKGQNKVLSIYRLYIYYRMD
jgi:hypothetical protein